MVDEESRLSGSLAQEFQTRFEAGAGTGDVLRGNPTLVGLPSSTGW